MRAALEAAAGKSGKPGLYPQEFASFQRSFEERTESGERRARGGSRKTMPSVQGWIFGMQHLIHLLKNAVVYALSCLFNYKSINDYLGLRVIQHLNSKLLIFKS